MTPFHVGMKVVRLGDFQNKSGYYTMVPIHGGVYTIREIKTHPSWGGQIGLLFEELINPADHSTGWEYSFCSTRFRPIVKTNIDIFTAMLAPAPKQTVSA